MRKCFCSILCLLSFIVIFSSISMLLITCAWTVNYFLEVSSLSQTIRTTTFESITNYVERGLEVPTTFAVGMQSYLETSDVQVDDEKLYSLLYRNFYLGVREIEGNFLSFDYVTNYNNELDQHIFIGTDRKVLYNRLNFTEEKIHFYKVINITTGEHGSDVIVPVYIDVGNSKTNLLAEAIDNPNIGVWNEPYFACDYNNTNDCIMYIEYNYHIVQSSNWIGTVRVSFAGRTISNFLRNITRKDATAFIIDMRHFTLIASSTVVSVFGKINDLGWFDLGKPVLYDAREFDNSLISEISKEIYTSIGSETFAEESFLFRQSGRMYVVDLVTITNDWLLVHVLPSSTFMVQPITLGLVFFLLSFLAAVIAIVASIFTCAGILKPLNSLVEEMSRVQQMELNVEQNYSSLREIRKIQSSFFFMINELKKYKAYLPQDLLITEETADNTGILFDDSESRTDTESVLTEHSVVSECVDHRLKKFELYLEEEEILVMTIYFSNYKDILSKQKSLYIAVYERILTDVVTKAISRFKGVLINIDEKFFVIKFEGYNIYSRGVNCALEVNQLIEKNNLIFVQEGLSRVYLTIGVCSGVCVVGNLGCDKIRQKILIGNIIRSSKFLSKYCQQMNIPCFIDQNTFSTLLNCGGTITYRCLPLDIVYFPNTENEDTLKCYWLIDKIEYNPDEWMYELKQQEKAQQYELCVKGFEELTSKNNHTMAKALYSKYLKLHNEMDPKIIKIVKNIDNYLQNSKLVEKLNNNREIRYISLFYHKKGEY